MFAKANAVISMYIGASILAGPLMAEIIIRRSDPKYCYLLSAMFGGTSFAMLTTQFEETLPIEKRTPLVLGDMQPLSFLQLMKTRALSRLVLVTGLQSFTEGRSIIDVLTIYAQADLGYNLTEVNRFVGMTGISLIAAGIAVKPLMNALGMRNFTYFSNFCNVLCNTAYCNVPPFSFFGTTAAMSMGIVLSAPGGRKRDAVESLIMKIGGEAGFGNGFISGSMTNFRAIINILGPLLFGTAYAWGKKKGYPALPFALGVLTILAAQLAMMTVTNEELGLDSKGHLIAKEKKQDQTK